MAKDKVEVSVTVEGMTETAEVIKNGIDAVLSFAREMADREKERKEKEDLPKEDWANEKDLVKKEFARVCKLMEKAKPGTQEYHALAEDLYKVKNVVGYWD